MCVVNDNGKLCLLIDYEVVKGTAIEVIYVHLEVPWPQLSYGVGSLPPSLARPPLRLPPLGVGG